MIRVLIGIRHWGALALVFVRELLLSAWQVARDILSPGQRYRSAIVAIPLEIKSDAAITLLADMITLTPGTTSLHVSPDRRILYVHAMNTPSAEAAVRSIKQGFETKVKEVLP